MDFLDRKVNDRIMHQDNNIEILGIVFQKFRDVLVIAILCGKPQGRCVCQDVLSVNRSSELMENKVCRRSVLGDVGENTVTN